MTQEATAAAAAGNKSDEITPPPTKKTRYDDPFDELRTVNAALLAHENVVSSEAACCSELAAYKEASQVTEKNPLFFWKKNASGYPIIFRLAQRIFCISASSTQSERDLSSVSRPYNYGSKKPAVVEVC